MDLLNILWLLYQTFALFLVLYFVIYISQIVFKIVYGYFFCYYFIKQKDLRKCYGEWAGKNFDFSLLQFHFHILQCKLFSFRNILDSVF